MGFNVYFRVYSTNTLPENSRHFKFTTNRITLDSVERETQFDQISIK